MDAGTVGRRAWANRLGTSPDVFEHDGLVMLARPWDSVVVVELGRCCVVAGPGTVIDGPAHVDRRVMGDADSLAALLGGPPTARAIGTADLWFTGIPVGADLGDTTEATDADLATLRADCSPAEFDESGLAELSRRWVSRTAAGAVAASAGYAPWAHTLAHVGVLSAPPHRGQGHAYRAAARAVDEALAEGLIAQWRCRVGNDASARLAQRLGFTWAGRQTAVRLRQAERRDPGSSLG